MSREMIGMPMQQPTPAAEREATPESVRIIQEISKEILQTLPRELVERGVPLAKANEETAGFDQQIKNLDPTIIIKLYKQNEGLQGTIGALFNKAIPQIVARASVKETSEEPAVTSATEKEPEMMIEDVEKELPKTIPLLEVGDLDPDALGEKKASKWEEDTLNKIKEQIEGSVTRYVTNITLKELVDKGATTKEELQAIRASGLRVSIASPIGKITSFMQKSFEKINPSNLHAIMKKWQESLGGFGGSEDTFIQNISREIFNQITESQAFKDFIASLKIEGRPAVEK